MKRNIRIERTLPYSPESVFHVLSDAKAMSAWLMPNDFEPRVGHHFQFRSKPQGNWNGVTDCEVLACDPPHRLSYSWAGQGKDGRKGGALGHTVVTWTLMPHETGTRLVLEHTGFNGFGEILVSFILGAGWKRMMSSRIGAMVAAQAVAA